MISKNKIKYIHSLSQKKARKAEGVFVAEGPKTVGDILFRLRAKTIIATEEWIAANPEQTAKTDELVTVTNEELAKASLLQAPQQVLAVFPQADNTLSANDISDKIAIALDGYTVGEYAASIGDDSNNVSHRFRRAIRKLKKVFSKTSF